MTIDYKESLLYLDNGQVLISNIVQNIEETDKVVLHRPAMIVNMMDGSINMMEWTPETDDEFIVIESTRVVTYATPKEMLSTNYKKLTSPRMDVSTHIH